MATGDIAKALEAFLATRTESAREHLAALVLVRMRRAARYAGVPQSDVDDAVHARVLRVMEALVEGKTESPNNYVWRAGVHAGRDWQRKQRSAPIPVEDDEIELPVGDDERERAEDTEAQIAEIRRLLGAMPDGYRQVLEPHYLRGVSIDELARDELAANPISPRTGKRRTYQQARAAVDQRLSRARDWLRARVSQERGDGS